MERTGNEFVGEIALVTGASRGIGRAVALDMAERGARLIGTATTPVGVESIDSMFLDAGLDGQGAQLHLGHREDIPHRMKNIMDMAGSAITMLVNNAGVTRDGIALRMQEDWDEVIGVNLTGTFRVTQAVLMGMVRARRGRVVTIGSVVGTLGAPGQANYAAAKAGLVGMSRALALEYASRNVKFNVVAPGYVDTDMTRALADEHKQGLLSMTELGRAYSPEEIAACVRETLLSDKSGELIAIDGGLTRPSM